MITFDFTHKIVFVTGATGNLGAAAADAFAAAGAHLILADRRADRLSQRFPQLAADPRHLLLPGFDVSDPEIIAAGVAAAQARFGRIDVLANSVGGYRAGAPVHETSPADWDFMMNLNARTAFLLSRAVIPGMIAQGSGKIIHVSSRAGLAGGANAAAYSASKAALLRLVESLAAETKAHGVNVNCILPGVIDTPQNRQDMPGADFDRWVSPSALAGVMLFLASDMAAPIHGAAIPAYGLS
ncbi:MAG: SDR family NAD(P)-dependent oxidoreductase [Caldilineales bacterium]|nr:SDR family NAD(P)-dependent oxidoreductase [Caldilineales bacterium]